jgi:hypothetical protein
MTGLAIDDHRRHATVRVGHRRHAERRRLSVHEPNTSASDGIRRKVRPRVQLRQPRRAAAVRLLR